MTLGPFLPIHWLEWKRLEGQGQGEFVLRSPSWAGGLEPSLDQYLNLRELDRGQFETLFTLEDL